MNYKVGDKVKFLNEVGGGEITEVIDYKLVKVLTDEGFEYPVKSADLLKVELETDSFFNSSSGSQKNEKPEIEKPKTIEQQITSDEPQVIKDNEEVNIFLSFVPVKPQTPTQCAQEMNLINDSNWHLMYIYQIRKFNSFESFPGILQPNYIEHLQTYELSEINEIKEIVVQFIFFRKIPYDVKAPIMRSITINPHVFYKETSFEKNHFFESKAISYSILEENPLKLAMKNIKQKDVEKIVIEKEIINEKVNKPKQFTPPKKTDTVEIDLHLIELLDDTKGLEPKEMLDFQMEKFKEELLTAQKTHHIKKIVFIHGKGNGSLKTKIRSHLDLNKINYQDASFQKYGFGATLVFV
ncbi:MAG: DUF2027 domain-containing protein [Bacteroidales bacterium]|nr:DUF2027 domain-containing protein [Bacteroidales bacterium]